jgi:hypothetical protein
MASPVVMMVLLIIGMVATSTFASSIDVDDLKWSWNASTVTIVPSSVPLSYYSVQLTIPMVSTPKAGLCRFENGRDDSTGRGWLKVVSFFSSFEHFSCQHIYPLGSYILCMMI